MFAATARVGSCTWTSSPVSRYATSAWYEHLLGAEPRFVPHATEAVWELADHRFLFIVEQPEHAGHAMHTIFVGDLDATVAEIAARGIRPTERETYSNGVRKRPIETPTATRSASGCSAHAAAVAGPARDKGRRQRPSISSIL